MGKTDVDALLPSHPNSLDRARAEGGTLVRVLNQEDPIGTERFRHAKKTHSEGPRSFHTAGRNSAAAGNDRSNLAGEQ